MNWTAPTLVEICFGLGINGYLPAEFQAFCGKANPPTEIQTSRVYLL